MGRVMCEHYWLSVLTYDTHIYTSARPHAHTHIPTNAAEFAIFFGWNGYKDCELFYYTSDVCA